MVAAPLPPQAPEPSSELSSEPSRKPSPGGIADDEREAYYDEVQERWPAERPSRKRSKRDRQRRGERKVVVRSQRLPAPDTARVSRALLVAQRELAKVEAERAARLQDQNHPDPSHGQERGPERGREGRDGRP
ncbi:hypothetical protein GCM10009788_11120 [Nocardioides humi]|uniref:Uncharacterized protein n=1 Tax=Nocardioides humi TaxID=449461 RepID=A0ABN2A0B8_9ACTN